MKIEWAILIETESKHFDRSLALKCFGGFACVLIRIRV